MVTSVSGGTSEPPINGQSGKTSAEIGRGHLRPEQQQRERHGRPERGEEREPLARAASGRSSPDSPDRTAR